MQLILNALDKMDNRMHIIPYVFLISLIIQFKAS